MSDQNGSISDQPERYAIQTVDIASNHPLGADSNVKHQFVEAQDNIANDDTSHKWDTDEEISIFEELLSSEYAENDSTDNHLDACTKDEGLQLRKRLRELGEDEFIRETLESGLFTAKKLLTAFGINPPTFLEGLSDDHYFTILGLAISRELSRRQKLEDFNTLDDVVELLKRSQNIIVLTGAGISTSLGIPDFRSKGTGFYAQVQNLGLSDPQEVFDLSLFREDPSIFYSVAKGVLPSNDTYSPAHAFIHLLQTRQKLLTNYTQNIDGLEQRAGITPDRLVQCHGSFATATCMLCRRTVSGDQIYDDLRQGQVAYCKKCPSDGAAQDEQLEVSDAKRQRNNEVPSSRTRKRSHNWQNDFSDNDSDYGGENYKKVKFDRANDQKGVMKPDITFFGEDLPEIFHTRLLQHDRDRVDLVLVLGTSLKVAPVSETIGVIPAHVPQIYMSREPCKHIQFDVELLGDCDVIASELCRRAGPSLALKHPMLKTDQTIKVQLCENSTSRWSVMASD